MAHTGTISKCFATGNLNITGSSIGSYAGGFIGVYYNGQSSDCYSRVETTNGISGGWVSNFTYSATPGNEPTRCYSAGVLTPGAASAISGFTSENSANLQDCFWDYELAGVVTDGAVSNSGTLANAETTANMKIEATFLAQSWDFVTVWAIDSSLNDGYPYLIDLPPIIEEPEEPPTIGPDTEPEVTEQIDNPLRFILYDSEDFIIPQYNTVLETHPTDLGQPDVEKLIDFIDLDYKGDGGNLILYLDDEEINSWIIPSSTKRTIKRFYLPLSKRYPKQMMNLRITSSASNLYIYNIEIDFMPQKRQNA